MGSCPWLSLANSAITGIRRQEPAATLGLGVATILLDRDDVRFGHGRLGDFDF